MLSGWARWIKLDAAERKQSHCLGQGIPSGKMPGAGWGECCDCSPEPGTAEIFLALPLTIKPQPRTLRAGVRGGDTTFSRLASGHSVSIQSVATSPIRLSPLAMFLWWGGGRGQWVSRGRVQGQETRSIEGTQDVVKVAGGTIRGCDG